MKTIKLNTGVIITQDVNGNITKLISPYCQDEKKKSIFNKLINKLNG